MMATMKRASVQRTSTKELISLVEQACLVAKDAATNLLDYIENSSKMALLAVRDCEKELDRMERLVDQKITSAISRKFSKSSSWPTFCKAAPINGTVPPKREFAIA